MFRSKKEVLESIDRLERSGIKREIEHIKITIERLEKMLEALSDQHSPYVESLIDGSFEQGYEQGYNDGADDGYEAAKESRPAFPVGGEFTI